MKQHKLSIIYIASGQKISPFTCGLPLALAVVLPGCLPQKEAGQKPNLQSPTSLQVKETWRETVFDGSMHLPWEVVVNMQWTGATEEHLLSILRDAWIPATIQPLSQWSPEHIIRFEADPQITQRAFDILRQSTGKQNVRVYFSGYTTAENTYTIRPNENRRNGYDSDIYRDLSLQGDWSSDIDSLLAFLPVSLKNSQNDNGESVKLVFNELPHPSLRWVHFAHLDSSLSKNIVTWDKNFSTPTPTNSHGNDVVWGAISFTNDGQHLAWISNVNRPVIMNIATVSSNWSMNLYSTTDMIKQYDEIIALAEANPNQAFVVTRSHWAASNFAMFDSRHQKMKTLKNILILNSAGNSNSNVPENEEAQNYHHFLSVWSIWAMVNNAKSSFSDWGDWVDVYMQGEWVRGINDNGTTAQIQGTSVAVNRAAAALHVLWNLMGGPSVISAEELADAVRNLNRTQVIQPDGTRKPVMHLWDLVSN